MLQYTGDFRRLYGFMQALQHNSSRRCCRCLKAVITYYQVNLKLVGTSACSIKKVLNQISLIKTSIASLARYCCKCKSRKKTHRIQIVQNKNVLQKKNIFQESRNKKHINCNLPHMPIVTESNELKISLLRCH